MSEPQVSQPSQPEQENQIQTPSQTENPSPPTIETPISRKAEKDVDVSTPRDSERKSQTNPEENHDKQASTKTQKDVEQIAAGREVAQNFLLTIIDAWRVKSSGKILVLTASHFLLVNPSDTQHPSLFQWSSLSSISFPKKNVIAMKFKEEQIQAQCNGYSVRTDKHDFNMVFLPTIYQTVSSYILDTIQRVLTDSELKDLNIESLGAPPVLRSTRSAISRFQMGSQGNPSILLDETIQIMNKFIQQGIPYLDLGRINDLPEFLPILFDCIPFIPTLKSIRIPPNNIQNLPEQIENLLKGKTNLRSININGKLTKADLIKILEPIKRNRDSHIRGLEFSVSDFHSEELDTIADVVSNTNIKTVGFHDALSNSDSMDTYFYATFLSPGVTKTLYCLNLENTYNLDVERLFPKLSKVRFLSLANCDLEITNVFTKIPLIVQSRLLELNLSGNRVSDEKFIDESIQFPGFLRSLILNDISWPTDSLQLFLYQVFKKIPKHLKLSLSNTTMDQNEWYKFFDFINNPELGGSYNSLSVLIWDNNPLHVNLFSFLKRNTNLTSLQMNNCFNNQHENNEIFDHMNDFLKSANNLRSLAIHGCDDCYLGQNTQKILSGINSLKNLEELDISDSRGGNQSIGPIENLLKQHPKLRINFDGLRPTEFEPYAQFCRNAVQIKVPESTDSNQNPSLVEQNPLLRITFPMRDLKFLKEERKASPKEIGAFLRKFYYYLPEQITQREALKAKRQGVEYKYDIVSTELDKPGNFSYLSFDDTFPRYIDDELISQYKRDTQPIDIKGKPEDKNYDDDQVFRSMIYNSRRFSPRSSPFSSHIARPISESSESSSGEKRPTPIKQQHYSQLPHIVNSPLKAQDPNKKPAEQNQQEPIEYYSSTESTSNQSEQKEIPNNNNKEELSSYSSDGDKNAVKTPRISPTHFTLNTHQIEEEESDEEENNEKPKKKEVEPKPIEKNVQNKKQPVQYDDSTFGFPLAVELMKYEYKEWKELDKSFTLQNMFTDITKQTRSQDLSLTKEDHQ